MAIGRKRDGHALPREVRRVDPLDGLRHEPEAEHGDRRQHARVERRPVLTQTPARHDQQEQHGAEEEEEPDRELLGRAE